MSPSVCLIGPGHIASNPRLVKEADALHAAGYRVRVVSGTSHPAIESFDRAIVASRPWPVQRLRLGSKWARLPRAAWRRLARYQVGRGRGGPATAAWAESELTGRLARAALAEPADLYIGHYLPGLYAAWKAANQHGSALGFDAEDSHVDELPDAADEGNRRAARQRLEAQVIPACRHFTAASPLIADAYARRYGRTPTTVLNVFPKADAPPQPVTTPYLRGAGPPTLYWFSQTIGPGRGLEQIVDAMNRMRLAARLHLRGLPAAAFREELSRRAGGVADRIHWHPAGDPDEMVRLAAEYDLGLALEVTTPPNRAICLTNKAFTYLLGGLPVVLSRTPAQERLAADLGTAARVMDLDDPAATGSGLDAWLGDKDRLAQSRSAAWDLGQTRFNWETEKAVFLDSVAAACCNVRHPSSLVKA